jgi:hypothetical protein
MPIRVAERLLVDRDRLTVPVVDIANVAAYWSTLPVEHAIDPRDFPSVAPSFPDLLLDASRAVFPFAVRIEAGERPKNRPDDPLFMCLATGYVPNGARVSEVFSAPYVTDAEGKLDDLGMDVHDGFTLAQAAVMLYVSLLSVSFMHCKNVTQEEITPAAALAKKQLRKHGIPKVSYRVLKIEPMTRALHEQGASDTKGLGHALHICRGHFKTYTAERPLFGQRVGTWWWDTNLRGARSTGTVVKDYEIGGTHVGRCGERVSE